MSEVCSGEQTFAQLRTGLRTLSAELSSFVVPNMSARPPRTLSPTSSAQELCESRGGRPGFPVSDSPYGLCGRKATLEQEEEEEEEEE